MTLSVLLGPLVQGSNGLKGGVCQAGEERLGEKRWKRAFQIAAWTEAWEVSKGVAHPESYVGWLGLLQVKAGAGD